jgi:hypothetical protein
LRSALELGDEMLGNESAGAAEDDVDLGKMSEDELLDFADEKKITVPRKVVGEDAVREFIEDALKEVVEDPEPEPEGRRSRRGKAEPEPESEPEEEQPQRTRRRLQEADAGGRKRR